jgi:hypothetical protein
MSEYRDRWSNITNIGESVELIQRALNESGAPISGAMLSTLLFSPANEAVVVAARLVFCEAPVTARPEHRYPAFVLRDTWVSCDDALQWLRDAPTEPNRLLPCRMDGSPSAERILTMHGQYEALTRPAVVLTFPLAEKRTPENLPAVAHGRPPFPTWNAAAMWWFDEHGADLKGKHCLRVVVPDYRALIENAELVRGELRVNVSVRDLALDWELHYVLGEDQCPVGRGYVSVKGDLLVIPVEPRFRKAELWLVSKGASLPAVHRTFWGLRDEHVELDANAIEVHNARILAGESDTVELKPFLDDAKKVTEVAETVTAFANTGGGFVYIGVQDDCMAQGQAKLEGLHKGDKRQAREAQTQKVREVIGRIDPVPVYSMTWIDLKSGPVLVIETPESNDVHALDATRVLVRRGASDRNATRAELEALFRERGGMQRGIAFEDDTIYRQ